MPVIVVWFSQWTIKQNEEILQQNDELNKKSQNGANYGYNAIFKKKKQIRNYTLIIVFLFFKMIIYTTKKK